MSLEHLTAISSIDGRYRAATAPLADYFSEYAHIRARVRVECEYFVALSQAKSVGLRALLDEERAQIRAIADSFSLDDARAVKEIERSTRHDVKSVEYFLKHRITNTSLEKVREWIHFALTSEDVNSVAYGLLLSGGLRDVILPALESVRTALDTLAQEHAQTPLLARTHGQAA